MKELEGFLNINKEEGMTSHSVVQKVRKILKIKRVGHTGTLDPNAEGVMLVCVGRATRTSIFINDLKKEYTATIKFGSRTDTQDACGETIETSPVPAMTAEDIEKELESFTGETEQIPPMFSAIKKNGTPLYLLARRGEVVARKSRKITIFKSKLLSMSLPFATFSTTCSSGTYIRTICEDLAKKLGTSGHMYSLTRTAIGSFSIKDAVTIQELESEEHSSLIIPTGEALRHYPRASVPNTYLRKALNGMAIPLQNTSIEYNEHSIKQNIVRLFTEDSRFFGIGERGPESINVKKILVDTIDFPN